MRTANAVYSQLANYANYTAMAAAKLTYADLAQMTVNSGVASGLSSTAGSANGRLALRSSASGGSSSGGSAFIPLGRASASGTATSTGSATTTARFRPSASGDSAASGSQSPRVIYRPGLQDRDYTTLAGIYAAYADLQAAGLTYADLKQTSSRGGAAFFDTILRPFQSGQAASTGSAAFGLKRGMSAQSAYTYAELAALYPQYAATSSVLDYMRLRSPGSSNGSAGLRRITRVTGTGSSTSTGSGIVGTRRAMSGSGASASTGSAAQRRVCRVVGTAASTASGQGAVRCVRRVSGAALSEATGSGSVRCRLRPSASGQPITAGQVQGQLLISAQWGIPL